MKITTVSSPSITRIPYIKPNQERLLLLKKELDCMPVGTLHITCTRNHYNFYIYDGGVRRGITRDKTLVHKLARKKYLQLLLEGASPESVRDCLDKFKSAGLIPAKITLTAAQYSWMKEDFPSNPNYPEGLRYATDSGVLMRSFSERDIGNMLESMGVPYRYEMTYKINVSELVAGLRSYLESLEDWDYNPRKLFYYRNGHCYWDVPDELCWMNTPGSIWLSYNYRDETVMVSVDFSILLADGSILMWEHAGLCLKPTYRCNTSERTFVMQYTGFANRNNLIVTMQNDLNNLQDISLLIETRILPRV